VFHPRVSVAKVLFGSGSASLCYNFISHCFAGHAGEFTQRREGAQFLGVTVREVSGEQGHFVRM
jgi:hypothetical protein